MLPVIDAVSRADIYPQFANTLADGFVIAKVAGLYPFESDLNLRFCTGIAHAF